MDTGKNLLPNNTKNQELTLKLASDERTRHLRAAESKGMLQVSDIELCDSVMFEIWSQMIYTYGNKWVENFGLFCDENGAMTPIVHHWAQSLSRIPLKRIERGLLKCTQDRPSPFPPTLPEFYALCERRPWE